MGVLLLLFVILFVFISINPVLAMTTIILAIIAILLIFHAIRKNDEKIISAEVVNRTQIMREEYRHSGFSIGLRGSPRMYWRVKNVPTHVEVKVNVVYENGNRGQLTLTEGSDRYNRIMAICEKRKEVLTRVTPILEEPHETGGLVDYIEIQTNQLVAGVYVIGEAIPEGNYDFRWIWGSGTVYKYVDNTTNYTSSNLSKWLGKSEKSEDQLIVNVVCKKGEYLHVNGNIIVEIRKSKPVKIKL